MEWRVEYGELAASQQDPRSTLFHVCHSVWVCIHNYVLWDNVIIMNPIVIPTMSFVDSPHIILHVIINISICGDSTNAMEHHWINMKSSTNAVVDVDLIDKLEGFPQETDEFVQQTLQFRSCKWRVNQEEWGNWTTRLKKTYGIDTIYYNIYIYIIYYIHM